MRTLCACLAVAVLSVGAAGCAGGNSGDAQRDVVEALRAGGFAPEKQRSTPSLLGVRSTVYVLSGGDELHVLPFASEARAESAARKVDSGGYSVSEDGRATQIEWIAPPHWFRAGRQVVIYLGTSARMLEALRAVAGPQFAGA